jgi:hypothetical protein
MAEKEASVSRTTAADVIFVQRGSQYRAVPPSHKAHPFTKPGVSFYNLTGHTVWVWFPEDFLLGSPSPIADNAERTFDVNPEAAPGAHAYSAYVVGPNEFVEGNSPPEIIIDR